jgi:glutamine synthetase
MAAVLGSALLGIEEKLVPTKPIRDNGYSNTAEKLARNWQEAINCFENDKIIHQIFTKTLIDNLVKTKKQELSEFKKIDVGKHWKYYVSAI